MRNLFALAPLFLSLTPVLGGTRNLNLKNSCSIPVRVGFTSGAIPGKSCGSSADCPSNGVCHSETSLCYYPSFLPGGYLDLSKGEGRNLSVNVNAGELYSGAIFVSTGCDTYGNACETGICRNKHCDLFTGAVGPHTRAEFTFDPKNVDFYDISLMHGVNVPMSMTPTGGNKQGDSYSCGGAGSTVSTNNLPKCTYSYNSVVNNVDQITNILFVAPSDLNNLKTCVSDNDCSGGAKCGLAAGRDPTGLPTTEVLKVCGNSVGK